MERARIKPLSFSKGNLFECPISAFKEIGAFRLIKRPSDRDLEPVKLHNKDTRCYIPKGVLGVTTRKQREACVIPDIFRLHSQGNQCHGHEGTQL